MTIHRCQGATIASQVIVDIKKAFCGGMAYVALSRVPDRKFLKIVSHLSTSDFMPAPINECLSRTNVATV